jgi:hypothetical protein
MSAVQIEKFFIDPSCVFAGITASKEYCVARGSA